MRKRGSRVPVSCSVKQRSTEWLRVNKDEGNLQVTVPCFSFRAEKYDLSYLESIIMKTAAYFTTEQALFRRLNGYLVCLN